MQHFLIDLSPRTDDRLRYCTNTRSIPSKFYILDRLKQSKLLNDEHKKSLFAPSVPIIFPQRQKSFPSVLPKRVFQVTLQKKSAQREPPKHKKTSHGKVSKWGSSIVPKRYIWKQRRDILASEKGLLLIKVVTPPVFNQLSWYGAVCPRSCFCVKQKFDYPVSYKAGPSKVSTFTKSHVPNWFTQEGDQQKKFSKADSLVDKILSCPRIKDPKYRKTLILADVETGIFLWDFVQQLCRKNTDVPDIYLTLLDATVISPAVTLNQNSKAEERRSWVPFKIGTSEAAKAVHRRWCCLWVCAKLSEG